MVGDDATIRGILGMNKTVEDYKTGLTALRNTGLDIVPHVCAGIHYGTIRGEYNAVDIISRIGPEKLVFITLVPTRGTGFTNVSPPRAQEVAELVRYARIKMPDCSIRLGCMRDRRNRELVMACIEAGVEGVVLPPVEVITKLRERNYNIEQLDICCGL
jgi:uncharacterized radical SAM superfamily protein